MLLRIIDNFRFHQTYLLVNTNFGLGKFATVSFVIAVLVFDRRQVN